MVKKETWRIRIIAIIARFVKLFKIPLDRAMDRGSPYRFYQHLDSTNLKINLKFEDSYSSLYQCKCPDFPNSYSSLYEVKFLTCSLYRISKLVCSPHNNGFEVKLFHVLFKCIFHTGLYISLYEDK